MLVSSYGGHRSHVCESLPVCQECGETGLSRRMANTGGTPARHPRKPSMVMKRFTSTGCYEVVHSYCPCFTDEETEA